MSRKAIVTKADISRVVRGALAAGFPVGRLVVCNRTGQITIVADRSDRLMNGLARDREGAEDNRPNDFDE